MWPQYKYQRFTTILAGCVGWKHVVVWISVFASLVRGTVTPLPVASQNAEDPYQLIAQESLFDYLDGLTAIQAYSGWRNSATEGEAEALDYVASSLGDFTFLHELGMELERQHFHVFLATEIWEARLLLTIQGQETEVPADALRGHRNDVTQALRFDSDGLLNDTDRNPVEVAGDVVLIQSAAQANALTVSEGQGKLVFLNYAVIDPSLAGRQAGTRIITTLIEKEIAGLVLITQFSDEPTASHGGYIGDGFPLEQVTTERVIPTLYARLEDLAPAGITDWEALARLERARLIWDTDVFSPGTSGNLVAHIPGTDRSQAIILGAHIDSPNSPGAMDNGINSVVLLEIARILNTAHLQPPVDLYLVWFGSEELWVYGSQHFVNTHQEVLDRTIAAFLLDGITESTPGPMLALDGWSHSQFGDEHLHFARYVEQKAAAHTISIDEVADYQSITSDNSVFSGFVPQAMLAFGSEQGGYSHSPYDTVAMAQGLGDLMEQVTAVTLSVALDTGPDVPELRITPVADRRALIVASHTEVAHMTPATLIDLARALAWEGFDVDVIPYGQAVTAADLLTSDLVVVLPVIDYPCQDGDLTVYDEAWTEEEIVALVDYVATGGLLVLTNSAHRVQMGMVFDANEDWSDMNALAGHFGVVYEDERLSASRARIQQEAPFFNQQHSLMLVTNNAIPFTMTNGESLAAVGSTPVVGLVKYGNAGGQVLVLADAGILGWAGFMPPEQDNIIFFRNLARYAR